MNACSICGEEGYSFWNLCSKCKASTTLPVKLTHPGAGRVCGECAWLTAPLPFLVEDTGRYDGEAGYCRRGGQWGNGEMSTVKTNCPACPAFVPGEGAANG